MAEPKIALADLKLILSTNVAGKIEIIINETYPIQTQIDYATGVLSDAQAQADMVAFIRTKRAELADVVAQIDALSDVSILDGFRTEDDGATWKTLIESKMTLASDVQKDIVAEALRNIKAFSV